MDRQQQGSPVGDLQDIEEELAEQRELQIRNRDLEVEQNNQQLTLLQQHEEQVRLANEEQIRLAREEQGLHEAIQIAIQARTPIRPPIPPLVPPFNVINATNTGDTTITMSPISSQGSQEHHEEGAASAADVRRNLLNMTDDEIINIRNNINHYTAVRAEHENQERLRAARRLSSSDRRDTDSRDWFRSLHDLSATTPLRRGLETNTGGINTNTIARQTQHALINDANAIRNTNIVTNVGAGTYAGAGIGGNNNPPPPPQPPINAVGNNVPPQPPPLPPANVRLNAASVMMGASVQPLPHGVASSNPLKDPVLNINLPIKFTGEIPKMERHDLVGFLIYEKAFLAWCESNMLTAFVTQPYWNVLRGCVDSEWYGRSFTMLRDIVKVQVLGRVRGMIKSSVLSQISIYESKLAPVEGEQYIHNDWLIEREYDAYGLFLTIKNTFVQRNQHAASRIQQQINSLKYDGVGNPNVLRGRMKELINLLCTTDAFKQASPVQLDSLEVTGLLAALPPSMADIDRELSRKSRLTPEDIYETLQLQYERNKNSSLSSNKQQAPIAHFQHKKSNRSNNNNNNNNNNKDKKEKNKDKTCHRCGRVGHIRPDCYALKHANGDTLTDAPVATAPAKGNSGSSKRKSYKQAYHDKQKLVAQGNNSTSSNVTNNPSSASESTQYVLTFADADFEDECETDTTSTVTFDESASNNTIGSGSLIADADSWILDSGATYHVSMTEKGMFDIELMPGQITLVMPNRTTFRATHWGKVRLTNEILLDKVILLKGGGVNIVCLAKVLDANFDVQWTKDGVIVAPSRLSTHVLLEFKRSGNLFKMKRTPHTSSLKSKLDKPGIKIDKEFADKKKAEEQDRRVTRARIPKKSKDDANVTDAEKARKELEKRRQSTPASVSTFKTQKHNNNNVLDDLMSCDGSNCVTGGVICANGEELPHAKKHYYHYIYGHPSNRKLREMNKSYDLNISEKDLKEDADAQCTVCIKASARAHAIHRSNKDVVINFEEADAKLERVHVDLIGPITARINNQVVRVKGLDGSRYILTVVDEYTRHTWLIPIAHKDNTFDALTHLFNNLNNKHSRYPSELHSDGGGEFINNSFANYCSEKGITQTWTTRDRPQHNGITERKNGYAMNRCRKLMLAAGAKPQLWCYAIRHVAMLINIEPFGFRRTNAKGEEHLHIAPPFNEFNGKSFNISKLHAWGANTEVREDRLEKGKLDAKTISGVYLGYDKSQNCSVVMTEQHKMYYSNDIVVMEDQYSIIRNLKLKSSYEELTQEEEQEDVKANLPSVDFTEEEKTVSIPDIVDDFGKDLLPEDEDEVQKEIEQGFNFPQPVSDVPPIGEAKRLELPADADVNPKRTKREIKPVQRLDPSKRRIKFKIKPIAFLGYGACPKKCPNTNYEIEPSVFHNYAAALACGVIDVFEPKNYYEAINCEQGKEWKAAIDEEIKALNDRKVFTLCELPHGRKAISTKWILKHKLDANGKPIKKKARLVARGYSQIDGIDFSTTFAPVVRSKSIKLMLAIAAFYDYETKMIDFTSAFLNATLKEELYISIPDGYKLEYDSRGVPKVFRLNKSLYGLKQAPLCWYLEITKLLNTLGYVAIVSDPCVLVKRVDDKFIMISIYVDDTLIVYNSKAESIWLEDKKRIVTKYAIKDLDNASFLLSMKITRDRNNRKLNLSQEAYVESILKKFDMNDCKPTLTPMIVNQPSIKELIDSPPLSTDGKTLLMSIVGSLMYLANCTRPDICFSVNSIARKIAAPTELEMKNAKHILRYLKGTKHYSLQYGNYQPTKSIIEGFSDADWAGDRLDSKSISGYVIKCFGSIVSWTSRKQSTVSQSSCESEYFACAATVNDILWLSSWLNEVMKLDVMNIPVYTDSTSCIAIAKDTGHHYRVKHIAVRVHLLREHIARGKVKLVYLSSATMPADVLTKSVGHTTFVKHATWLMCVRKFDNKDSDNESREED